MSSELIDCHHNKTAVLLIEPETGRLPNGMGPLARFISGKSGGMGDVVSTLCEGLTRRGVECHLATLNLTNRGRLIIHSHDWMAGGVIISPSPSRISGVCY